tara:strand:- start:2778 stop:3698 length:921 start_codon:yes stop_codon:yes gene_type:complete
MVARHCTAAPIVVILLAISGALQLRAHRDLSLRVAAYVAPNQGGWAIVAGGSDGLGAEWAAQLSARGLNLLLIARREEPLLEHAARIRAAHAGVEVATLALDLALMTAEDVEMRILGSRDVRVLVYNAAATGPRGDFLAGSFAKSATAIDVNVRGLLLLTHAFANRLHASGVAGGIVLMSSLSGIVGSAFISNYAATKSYITTLARGLFVELRSRQIDVLACVAGPTTTPTYLKTLGEVATRKLFIEQSAEDVVTECFASLGREPSVETGALNKIARSLFVRLLPVRMAARIFSEQTGEQMGFSLK